MNYEYKVDGKDVTLDPDETMMGVRYTELTPHSARAELVGHLGAQYENRFELPNENTPLYAFLDCLRCRRARRTWRRPIAGSRGSRPFLH